MTWPIEVALTIDDAPSIAPDGPVAFDPTRMDTVRETLTRAGVEHCVAFVIGEHARGHEHCLERWLDAGYALGNHTDDHVRASGVDRASFVASIERCDRLLRSVGAFEDGNARYFRFPYGDRGATPFARAALLAACEERGYTIADVSIDLFDYCYEAPLAGALSFAPERAQAVQARFVANARATLKRAERLGRLFFGVGHMHVVALHFGLVAERTLPALLTRLAPLVRFSALERAVTGPAYARSLSDLTANGIIAHELLRPHERVLRRLARLSRRAGWFEQHGLGPRWPHLAD